MSASPVPYQAGRWLTGAPPRFISKFGRKNPEEILAGEYLLCQGIRFAFDVKHPFRALKGAAMELRRLGDIEVSSHVHPPSNELSQNQLLT